MAQIKRFRQGLQALMILAMHEGQCSSNEMAESLRCEPTALRKILSQLAAARLVEVKQGRTGGYRLAKLPDDISLSEVYRSVCEEDPQWGGLKDLSGDDLFGSKTQETFRDIITDINVQVDRILENYTIADLLDYHY